MSRGATVREHQPKQIRGVLSFAVMCNDAMVDYTGPLHVVVDNEGLSLRWLGTDGWSDDESWCASWTEFRQLHGMLKELDQYDKSIEILKEEIASLRHGLEEFQEKKEAIQMGVLVPFPIQKT